MTKSKSRNSFLICLIYSNKFTLHCHLMWYVSISFLLLHIYLYQNYLLNAHRIYQNNAFPEWALNILFVTNFIGKKCLKLRKNYKLNVFYLFRYSFKQLEREISSKFDFEIILAYLGVNYIMYRFFCSK